MTTRCKGCGTEFSHIKPSDGIFCSTECRKHYWRVTNKKSRLRKRIATQQLVIGDLPLPHRDDLDAIEAWAEIWGVSKAAAHRELIRLGAQLARVQPEHRAAILRLT